MKQSLIFGVEQETFYGCLTVLGGMCIHFCLGIVAIWGNIVIYETSKLRETNENLTTSLALFVFPMTLAMASIGMQLANKIKRAISPQRQIFLGGSIFCGSLFLAGQATYFFQFFMLYAISMGLGYGLIYFLPIECAWSFFPEKQSTVGGAIMCFYSFGAVFFAMYTAYLVNPMNEPATIVIQNGATTEHYFAPDSIEVQNLTTMFNDMAVIVLCLLTMSFLLIRKNDNTRRL